MAEWTPCSALRKALGKPKPPVTWEFNTDALAAGDPRLDANAGFIQKYGFNSMVPGDRCFARFTAGGRGVTISDNGFRVDVMDTMFFAPLMYNGGHAQNWRANPLAVAAGQLPTDVNSAQWLRKRTLLPEDEAWELMDAVVPPPEPTHLSYPPPLPPSRVKRAMLYHEEAAPASRPTSGAPTQTGEAVLAVEPVLEKDEYPVQEEQQELAEGVTEWRNASMSSKIFARDSKEYCDSAVALDVLEDMDQLYGYCDCMGWAEDD